MFFVMFGLKLKAIIGSWVQIACRICGSEQQRAPLYMYTGAFIFAVLIGLSYIEQATQTASNDSAATQDSAFADTDYRA